jgi:hypothetical protein
MMDCTPEQLPLELKMQLMTLLQCGQNDLDAYIRPGCVHLTVNMSLDQNCGQHVSNLSARAAANNLLQGTGAEFWASRTLLVHFPAVDLACLADNCIQTGFLLAVHRALILSIYCCVRSGLEPPMGFQSQIIHA